MNHGLQLFLRVIHIVLGVYWVGATFFLAMYLEPSVRAVGPDGGKVMVQIFKRGYLTFVLVIAVLTVAAGIWLLWIWSNGFSPLLMGSPMGMVLSTGGLFGVLALAVGGSVMAPTGRAIWRIAVRLPAAGDETERNALGAELGRLSGRMRIAGRVVALLMLVSVVCMAVARYV